jgi:hypothetical protein
MRAVYRVLFAAALISTAARLPGSVAAAASDGGATVTPYEQCDQVTPDIRACATGRIVVRRTETPSGAISATVIDTGRVDSVNSATGCVLSSSYQSSQTAAASPPEAGHVVVRTAASATIISSRVFEFRCDRA